LILNDLPLGIPTAITGGMTPEKKAFLLGKLQEAIDEAISDSIRIGEVVDEMKRCGYDLLLMVESTVTISPTEDRQSDVVPEPRLASDGEVTLTAEDLEFLQELNIAA
jgi:hypothetical protein